MGRGVEVGAGVVTERGVGVGCAVASGRGVGAASRVVVGCGVATGGVEAGDAEVVGEGVVAALWAQAKRMRMEARARM